MGKRNIKKFTGPKRIKVLELYDAGYSASKVADLVDQSHSTVLYYLRENRKIRPRHHYTKGSHYLSDEELDKTLFLYRDMNLSCKEIGKILGKHEMTIRRRLRTIGALNTRSESLSLAYKMGRRK